jgi:hypothetical protein
MVLAMGAPLAIADEAASSMAVKAPAPVAKPKFKTKPRPAAPIDGMSMQAIRFSDPSAPLSGAAKPPPPAARDLAAEPEGGAALDLKWHAEKHVNNPYWEPWVPNGQGEGVKAGLKVGF